MIEKLRLENTFCSENKLHNINFTLYAGEIHGIVTTSHTCRRGLYKIITGEIMPNYGTLYLNGIEDSVFGKKTAKAKGIGAVSTASQLVPNMAIYENIFIISQGSYFKKLFPRRVYIAETRKLLDEAGLEDVSPTAGAWQLSVAEGHLVEIIKASYMQTKILVLDDITAKYSEEEIKTLKRFLLKKKAQGLSIIFLTNRHMELFSIADKITVIRSGTTVAHLDHKPVTRNELLIHLRQGSSTQERVLPEFPRSATAFSVENFTTEYVMEPVSFQVRQGEILGIIETDWNKSVSLAKGIYGMTKHSGRVYLGEKQLNISSAKQSIKNKIAYMGSSDQSNVFENMDIAENISILLDERYGHRFRIINPRINLYKALEALNALECTDLLKKYPIGKALGKTTHVDQLKIVLAKWFCVNPKVLILENPHIGFDEISILQFHKLISVFAAKGTAVIIFSTNQNNLMRVCDRTLFL